MAGVNKVIIVGNLGRDPEIKYTQANVPVANFSVATTESWKDKQTGEWQEKTEWHRVVAWRYLAEKVERTLKKGKQVYVEGKLETRKWTGQDGNERYTTEIIARDLMALGRKDDNEETIANRLDVSPWQEEIATGLLDFGNILINSNDYSWPLN